MADDPAWLKLLERLGFNVTRLRWRLYQLEQKRKQERRLLPDALRWLQYEHTICSHCGAIVPRGERKCPQCGRRVPGPLTYRVLRLFGFIFPANAPVVTSIFLALILFVFGLSLVLEGLGALWTPSNETVYRLGALIAGGGFPWTESLWRSLTFALVHGGLLHILFNGVALYLVGPVIEEAIGPRRMLVLITVTQLASAAATVVWYTVLLGGGAFTVGASGFLSGLIGFGVGFCHSQGPRAYPQRNFFLQWAVYVLVFGLLLGANNAAHFGGFIAGLPLGVVLERQRMLTDRQRPGWTVLFGACLLMWMAAVGMLIFRAVQG